MGKSRVRKKKGKGGKQVRRAAHLRPEPTHRLGSAPTLDATLAFEIRDDQRAAPVMVGAASSDATVEVGDNPALVLPTIAIRSISQVARVEGLERLLSEEVERSLHPSGKHMLRGMRRVFNPDGTDFVRAHVLLQLRDRPLGQPFESYYDFPTRYIGMLLDASIAESAPPRAPSPTYHWTTKKPTWVGSYSFDHVWRQSEAIATDSYDSRTSVTGDQVEPRGVMAMSALSLMKDAHLVRVDPEQVQVLPDWEEMGYLWDYAQDVTLPFDRIYLDFEGPGGFAPVHIMDERMWPALALPLQPGIAKRLEIELRGALVWRDTDNKLVVTVIACPTQWLLAFGRSNRVPWNRYEVLGSVVFGTGSIYEHVLEEVGEMTMRLGDTDVYARPLGIATTAITEEKLPGFVQLPIDASGLEVVRDFVKEGWAKDALGTPLGQRSFVAGWATVVLAAAGRSLAALSILEADEVELVDAPVEKRVRDRAEKRGWQVAQVVFIRPPKKYLQPNPPSGEEARYSHRFWVRAHVKHHPLGTRVADARPDLVRACHRCGTCRRVPTRAFIKGPPDRPLVPKSLAVKRERPKEVVLPRREDEQASYMAPGVV